MSFTQQTPNSTSLLDDNEMLYASLDGTRPVPPVPPTPPVVAAGQVNFHPDANHADLAPSQLASEPPVDMALLREMQHAIRPDAVNEGNYVSRTDLASILDGFARVLRGETVKTELRADDRSAEIAQMKELLLEAQETIITLLNDRVYDRAKIARLEAEVRLMPDLQAQSNKAIGLASRTDEFDDELKNVRAEVERLRSSYVRTETDGRSWIARLLGRP